MSILIWICLAFDLTPGKQIAKKGGRKNQRDKPIIPYLRQRNLCKPTSIKYNLRRKKECLISTALFWEDRMHFWDLTLCLRLEEMSVFLDKMRLEQSFFFFSFPSTSYGQICQMSCPPVGNLDSFRSANTILPTPNFLAQVAEWPLFYSRWFPEHGNYECKI